MNFGTVPLAERRPGHSICSVQASFYLKLNEDLSLRYLIDEPVYSCQLVSVG